MARDFAKHPSLMRQLAKAIELYGADALFFVGRAVAEEVIPDTPKDTGLARSNWRAALNAPNTSTRGVIAQSPGPLIAEATSVFRSAKPDDTLFYSNHISHIGELDQGKSSQAGAGFVRNAFRRGLRRGIRLAGGVSSRVRR